MNNTGVTGLTAKKKDFDMRVFGPRTPPTQLIWHTRHIDNISREISIEHPSVGLASLAQSREISIEHPSTVWGSLRSPNYYYDEESQEFVVFVGLRKGTSSA